MSFPKTGKSCPAKAIAAALHTTLGYGRLAAKTAAIWGEANERTAKNWIAGRYSPSSEHLINLMRESDAVFETVMLLAGRDEAFAGGKLDEARTALVVAISAIDRACRGSR